MLTSNLRALLRLCAAAALIAMLISSSNAARTARAEGPNAIVSLAGCSTHSLPANDDDSTGLVSLPFTVNFFGTNYTGLYVNNNGNVTFHGPLSDYTPYGLAGTSNVIIAPFFADVDTTGSGSGIVTYGATTYGSRPAFCVNWINVGYYASNTDKLNSFQLLLVQSTGPGTSAGDFDIYFNYDKILWETGDASGGSSGLGGSSAHVGYSNGTSSGSFELAGSGKPGSFLNSNTSTGLIYNSRASLQVGRYILSVRNGVPPSGGTIAGTVYANSVAPGNVIPGALVYACRSASNCYPAQTSNASGQYSLTGLPNGTFAVAAFPPTGVTHLIQQVLFNVTVSGGGTAAGNNFVLLPGTPPPAGTTVLPTLPTSSGIPVVPSNTPITIQTTHECHGGVGSYTVTTPDPRVHASGSMTENPAGTYTAIVPPLRNPDGTPYHGPFNVHITKHCPDGSTETVPPFDAFSDPSGTVTTLSGVPIAGATVTLFHSDTASGPFIQVPNGSGMMAPSNRNDPDTTDSAGRFGWDVVPGFYNVRAQKTGCSSPASPSQAYSESGVLQIPPPVTGLRIVLYCGGPLFHVYLPQLSR